MIDTQNANSQAIEKNKVTRYLIDDLNLDVQRGELTRHGEVLTLPKLSYDLLVALAQASPALLSQQELMLQIWPDRVIGDETLKQRVKLLRRSLSDNASDPQYIEAVRGRGYRLIPEVICECVIKRSPSVMLDLTANDLFPNLLSAALHRWWRRVSFAGLLLFSIVVGSALITSVPFQQKKDSSQTLTHDKIASQLEKKVGNTAFKLYQRGREYYKRYRDQDNKIAIGFYDTAIAAVPSFSEAYAGLSQAYSQQYFQFDGNEESKQAAIDNAYLAISYNSNSADAYKALGTAYYVSGWLSKSINALLRGINFAETDRETLTNLAFIYSEQGRFEQAFYWHKKALKIDPDYAVAMLHLAITLQRTEHFDLALRWYQKAFAQQPDYLLTSYHLTQLYIQMQQYDKAREVVNKGLLSQPDNPLLLEALADSYFFQEALDIAQSYYSQALEMRKNQPIGHVNIISTLLMNNVHKTQKDQQENITRIEHFKDKLVALHLVGNEKPNNSLYLAEINALLNNDSIAIRYLVQALEQGQVLNYQIDNSFIFKRLKKSPRYIKLYEQNKREKAERLDIDKYFSL
jgi:DNA-binding winged helix-turn-helix (wHTH) protein/Flp pilus assembly protein TadD